MYPLPPSQLLGQPPAEPLLPLLLPTSVATVFGSSSWSKDRDVCCFCCSCCDCEELISEMAPLRSSSSSCTDPPVAPSVGWPRRRCFSYGASFKYKTCAAHQGNASNNTRRRPANDSALRVMVSRELLEHISDYMPGIPNLLVEFARKNGGSSNAVAAGKTPRSRSRPLSPFHDDSSNTDDDFWSACYDPQAANGLVTRLALEQDDRRVLCMLLRLHQFPAYKRLRKLRLEMAVTWCVELGNLQTLKWLQPKLPAQSAVSLKSASSAALLLDAAIRNGDVQMMKWIQQNCAAFDCCRQISSDAICSAPTERVFDIIKWLHANKADYSNKNDQDDGNDGGGSSLFSPEIVNYVAQSGCLDAIQFIHNELLSCPVSISASTASTTTMKPANVFSAATMDAAAGSGHLDVVQFLHVNRNEGCSTHAMDVAARNGHLKTVRFLHVNRNEGCTVSAMDGAAANGHLPVVKFLHETRREGCTVAAIDQAARNGHLKVVRFLNEHCSEGCTGAAMDDAALFGQLSIVQYLHQSRAAPAKATCTTEAMDNAASAGHLEIVRFLHEYRHEGCTTNAMDLAAQNGHLEVVRFLHENRHEGCTVGAMDLGASSGHLEIVQFLHINRREGCTKRALSLAARNGFCRVVQFLVENRREGCAEDALRCAYRSGRFEVARYLHARGFMGNVAKCVISCCCSRVIQYS